MKEKEKEEEADVNNYNLSICDSLTYDRVRDSILDHNKYTSPFQNSLVKDFAQLKQSQH